MVEKWSIPYPASTGKEPRKVYVYVPDSFDADDTLRYPVLYMFDGHNVFFDEDATYGKCWGLKEYMDQAEKQLMIVAVECNQHPDGGRLSEYTPFAFRYKRCSIVPRAEETLDWYTGVLKPMIDKLYPTLPDREHTFIAGSSMGGLMSLYALLTRNAVFSRAAALSPSLWVAPQAVGELIRTADIAPGTVLYMDYGEQEMSNRRAMPRAWQTACTQLFKREVLLTSRIVPGGTHCEASWEKQIPYFINTLLYQQ